MNSTHIVNGPEECRGKKKRERYTQ